MQDIARFRFCDTLRFSPIQNLRYSGQGTASMVVRNVQQGLRTEVVNMVRTTFEHSLSKVYFTHATPNLSINRDARDNHTLPTC
jgi:hypothetical protein